MKTKKQILDAVKNGKKTQAIDERDFSRLVDFFPIKDWEIFGFEVKAECDKNKIPPPEKLTKKNVLSHLKSDLEFAFEKALNKRGISSSCMYEVIKMWLWVLDDELADFDNYAMYGLPLYKAVALKYNLENPIGKDSGDEDKYNEGE